MLVRPKSPEEAAEANAEKNRKVFIDRSTLGIAGIGLLINGLLALYARRTLATLKTQVDVTQPRLHIDCVRAANFENGQSPVFFVKIINSGIIAAQNVTISMEAGIDPGRTVRYQKEQSITIPADDSRECFIRF